MTNGVAFVYCEPNRHVLAQHLIFMEGIMGNNDSLCFRSSLVDHHDEHMENVRQFHKTLQEKESALSNCAVETHPSRSALFSALRYQLSFCFLHLCKT